ncbi:MAG: hypothetical protein ABL893_02150 [Hyphomicrobium sp.]|nr:hypothetical protein [Hyphomicrobium sp.]
MQFLLAGALYFGLTYAAGFACGAVRETFVVPRLGQFTATLIELPVMLAATYFAARFVIGRMEPRPNMVDRAVIGATGFVLLMAAEAIFAGLLRGWTFAEWLAHLQTADGALSLVMFGLFGVMPMLVRRA